MESLPGGLLVSLLGPVEVSANGRPLAISQQGLRALLALLALTPGRVVGVATLIDGLWQEERSRPRELNLHSRVFQLRKYLAGLEPDRDSSRIVTDPHGYRMVIARQELDLGRFTQLARQGRDIAEADPAAGAELLFQALGLWRGPALSDVVGSSDRLAAEAGSLEQQRLAVYADYGDAMIRAGWHRELIGGLAVVVAENPWQERLRRHLMLAYYRSGRRAEALACYEEGSEILGRDLGVLPGPELRALHSRILRADPALAAPWPGPPNGPDRGATARLPDHSATARLPDHSATARLPDHSATTGLPDHSATTGLPDHSATGPAGVASRRPPLLPVPRQLPAGIRPVTGRAAELGRLDALIRQARPAGAVLIIAIGGPGGAGKTTLALHWAHRVAAQFPDGQLHVDLGGQDPAGPPVTPAAALAGFLAALGVPAGQVPESPDAMAALYRSVLADRRMLILLDNASDPGQVRPLLPAAPGCLVLVTSRTALTGLTTTDGAVPLWLGPVSPPGAGTSPAGAGTSPAGAGELLAASGQGAPARALSVSQ